MPFFAATTSPNGAERIVWNDDVLPEIAGNGNIREKCCLREEIGRFLSRSSDAPKPDETLSQLLKIASAKLKALF